MPTKSAAKKPVKRPAKKTFNKNAEKPTGIKGFAGKLFSRGRRNPLIAVVIVFAVVGLGYYGYVKSNADANNAVMHVGDSSQSCSLAGRVWGKVPVWNDKHTKIKKYEAGCTTTCLHASATYKPNGDAAGYCDTSIAPNISQSTCVNDYHRYFLVNVGCAKRADGDDTANAKQCLPGYPNYNANPGKPDVCIKATTTPTSYAPVPKTNSSSTTSSGSKSTNTKSSTSSSKSSSNKATKSNTPNAPKTALDISPSKLLTPPATNTKTACTLLGRVWGRPKGAKTAECEVTCQAGAGTLTNGVYSKVKYCDKAVTAPTAGTLISNAQASCAQKHRVWLVEGCARRPDQKDANDAIQCLPGFPYYNANFKNKKTGDATTGDWCEVSQTAAKTNEAAGTPGAIPAASVAAPATTAIGSTDDQQVSIADTTVPVSDGTTPKIVLYKRADFKVSPDPKVTTDTVTVTASTATIKLPKGWSGKVGSYKIVNGKWEICGTDNFAPASKCTKRWASDASNSMKIASLRPVVVTTAIAAASANTDTTVIPSCVDASGKAVQPKSDNTCPKNSPLACPTGYTLKNGQCLEATVSAVTVVPVDASFASIPDGLSAQDQCELLGREWIAAVKGKVVNGGQYGCSMKTCALNADGAPRANGGKPYCVSNKFNAAYAVKLSAKQCSDLHRVYIKQVDLCAAVPNRQDKDQQVVKAKQCVAPYTTYTIWAAGKGKQDECFKPNAVQKAKAQAKQVGSSVVNVLHIGAKVICSRKTNYHWTDGKCIQDRGITTAAAPAGISGGNSSDPKTQAKVDCSALGRPQNGPSACKRSCSGGANYVLTNYSDASKWDKCVLKACPTGAQLVGGKCIEMPTPAADSSSNPCAGSIANCVKGGGSSVPTSSSSSLASTSNEVIVTTNTQEIAIKDGKRQSVPYAQKAVVYGGSWKVCVEVRFHHDPCVSLHSGVNSLTELNVNGKCEVASCQMFAGHEGGTFIQGQ